MGCSVPSNSELRELSEPDHRRGSNGVAPVLPSIKRGWSKLPSCDDFGHFDEPKEEKWCTDFLKVPEYLSFFCNRSYCEAGIWGWLEDGSPPWRLLVPLERPHLWCGCHGDPPVRPNSNSAEFRSSVVLNHSCYEVLGLNWP